MKPTLYPWIFLLLLIQACEPWSLDIANFVTVQLTSATATGLTTAKVEAQAPGLNVGRITDHGFVFSSTEEDPTLNFNDNKFSLGVKEINDTPNFSTDITGLLPNTNYQVRAYVVVQIEGKDAEEIYSTSLTISTGTGTVLTEPLVYESGRSLQLNGRITGVEAGILAINHGFCWSTSNDDPRLENQGVNSFDLGLQRSGEVFSFTLDSLENNTRYYLRAYARLDVNGELETTYGEVLTFDGQLKDIWELRTDLPERFRCRLLFTIEGKHYFCASGDGMWVYDPQTEEWSQIQFQEYFYRLEDDVNSFAIEDKGYIITMYTQQVYQYDPQTNEWTRQADLPTGEILVETLTFGLQDRGYYGFGESYEGPPGGRSRFWTFDPSQKCNPSDELPGCWTIAAGLSARYGAVGMILDDKIYLGMGADAIEDQTGSYVDVLREDWWMYDPNNPGKFEQRSKFPGRLGTAEAAFSVKGQGYVFGNDFSLWQYLPDEDQWEERLPPPVRGDVSKVLNIEGQVFLTIRPDFSSPDQIWEYIPN